MKKILGSIKSADKIMVNSSILANPTLNQFAIIFVVQP